MRITPSWPAPSAPSPPGCGACSSEAAALLPVVPAVDPGAPLPVDPGSAAAAGVPLRADVLGVRAGGAAPARAVRGELPHRAAAAPVPPVPPRRARSRPPAAPSRLDAHGP